MSKSASDMALNVHDLRLLAKKKLPYWLFEFVDRGTEDEVALYNNRAAFGRIKLNTRVLTDVSGRSQSISLFGKEHCMPIGIAPTATGGMMWYQGELELARAAKANNIPFTVGSASTTRVEDVARLVGGTLWFQMYLWSDDKMSARLVERAKGAGCEALLVTVDGPVSTNREYNIRNGFTSPFRFTPKNIAGVAVKPGWMCGVLGRYLTTTGMPKRENAPVESKENYTKASAAEQANKGDAISWDHFSRLREIWPGTLIIKGILTPRDAERAVAYGADGVLVSNHGGRNFDSSMAPIDALPAIVDTVGSRATVMVDSGFRRGSDIVKALAIGARMVMVGRAPLWGVTVEGQKGVTRAIALFREEISRTMAYLGCNTIGELNRECVSYVATSHHPLAM